MVGSGVDGDIARADDAPAPFSLGLAEGRTHARHGIRHAARMRHGIEAVGSCQRPDPDRLEQDVITGVAGHASVFRGGFLLCDRTITASWGQLRERTRPSSPMGPVAQYRFAAR